MALTDQLFTASDQVFRDRVTMAAVIAAQQIQGEGQATGHASYYAKRAALATAVLNSPTNFSDRFAWSVAANPAITLQSSDGDIQYTVNSVFSDIAGVNSDEIPV